MAKASLISPPPVPPPTVTLELTWDEFLMLHRFVGQSSRHEVEKKDENYRRFNPEVPPVQSHLISEVYGALHAVHSTPR